jgi:hypothetical protein
LAGSPIRDPDDDLARRLAVLVAVSAFVDPADRGKAHGGRGDLAAVDHPEGVAPVVENASSTRAKTPGFYFARRLARVIRA